MFVYYCLPTLGGDSSSQVTNFVLLKTMISLQVKAFPSKCIFRENAQNTGKYALCISNFPSSLVGWDFLIWLVVVFCLDG